MDEIFMRRAIELAKLGTGYTNPNPLVGAVIVKEGRIIGEGYHQFYGGPHAEVNAFDNASEDVKGATMYVTLEPCSHYGRTPPCANAIVKKGIKKVVIGMIDPNPLVAGKGIEILKNNGIEVVTGILKDEVKKLNEIFIKYITINRPFCILKTAMTLDGKIATKTGDSKWISNEISRNCVHKLRHRVAAIMVGINTVLQDNPRLTTRLEGQTGVDPIRVIVDSSGRIPLDAEVLNVKSKARTIIATTEKITLEKRKSLEGNGAEVLIVPSKDGWVDLNYLMQKLGEKKIDSVLIEGGSTLNYSALREGIVDKIITFIAPKIIGGLQAKTPVGGEGIEYIKDAILLHQVEVKQWGEDVMVEAYVKRGD